MAAILSPSENPTALTVAIPLPQVAGTVSLFSAAGFTLPSGSLRIGGDSPNGLVLVGEAPAARNVDLFDRETKVFVASTTSGVDGTYSFSNLSARSEGYDVIIRGIIGSGERDIIIPGVHPG